jgi:hypothetical protein
MKTFSIRPCRLVSAKAAVLAASSPDETLDKQHILARELLGDWPALLALPAFSNVEGAHVYVVGSPSQVGDVKFKRWCDKKSCALRDVDVDPEKVGQRR